ncbi:MAG: PucR family transcriptional regulator [Motilibacteraceae bacterium]
MFPTVADVLALDPVRRGAPRVVAGEAGLQTPVRWVHVGEVPDIAEMLRGGELVLMTGIGLPADDPGLVRYVDTLVEVRAAGLVVELGRRFSGALPAALVGRARKHGLPVVELHRETRFVAVTEAVHALIVDAQLAELRATEEVHETFTELSVEGADPAEVLRQVARMSGRPAVLENLGHQVLAYDAAGVDAAALLDRWENRSREVRTGGRTEYDRVSGWLVTTVGARGTDWGRLVLLCDGDPLPRHTILVERAASALALNRLVQRDLESLERQTHRTLLAGILAHSVPSSEVALRARALGVPLDGRRLLGVVVRPAGPSGPAALEQQARMRDLADLVAAAVRDASLPALVGGLEERGGPAAVGVLLAMGSSDRDDKVLTSLASALRQRAARTPGSPARLVVAAGSAVGSVRDARRTLLEAGQVAEAAEHQGDERPWYRLPDVRVRGLLHLLRDDARLQTYVERELGPLLAYDEKHRGELVRMLQIYLDCGRNKSAAADAAHLSRPSFYERLHRIEKVLGVDLDSVESCLSLHVALLALQAVRGTGAVTAKGTSSPA